MNNDKNFIAQQIRAQYTEKASTELEKLRKLDRKVKRPSNIFAYVFGSIGALVMGSGMSLIMTDISETIGISSPMIYGIIIGIVGLFITIVNYPIYKCILNKRRNKFADEVISLSDKIIESSGNTVI